MNSHYSLKQCQQLFLQSIIEGDNSDSIVNENTGTANSQALAAENLSGAPNLSRLINSNIKSPDIRISIYKNNYQMALVNCLKSTFLNVSRLLGESNFKILALKYIEANPSVSEDLNQYGKGFAKFISNRAVEINEEIGDINKGDSVIFYVAQADYLKQCCYYAENNQLLLINAFINMPIETQMETLFIRQPSLYLLASPVELRELDAIKELNDLAYRYSNSMVYYLFFRNEGKVQIRTLEKSLYDLLTVFDLPTNMNALNEHQLEELPILLREGWLKLAGAML